MEENGIEETTREAYEQAIANVPPSQEKRFWRRYIYLWINYAIYEEIVAKDIARTRAVYKACIELVPHKLFTFTKIWIMFAKFEIRQRDLMAARKVLGIALGKCPKPKLYKTYINVELQLREFDRCRKLYKKFLEYNPENCANWMKFAELEGILGDTERARAIYKLAVSQSSLEMPEIVWKAYIDFEIKEQEISKARNLHKRLLEHTRHVKVWLSWAKFELSVESTEKSREVYKSASLVLKDAKDNTQRAMLLEAWKEFEAEHGDNLQQEYIQKLLPKCVMKRRKVYSTDGSDAGWEEHWDYVFPDNDVNAPNLKLLQMAKKWKEAMDDKDDSDTEDESDSDDSN